MAILHPKDWHNIDLELSAEHQLSLAVFADELDQCDDVAKLREVAKTLHWGFLHSECAKEWLKDQLMQMHQQNEAK